MSKYVKEKIEDLMNIGSDETLFKGSIKTYYPLPWWKFWGEKKLQSEKKGIVSRQFDEKGNLVSISRGRESLDVRSKVITEDVYLPYDHSGLSAKRRILRILPNGTFEESNYFANGERRVLKGTVNDEGGLENNALVIFDAKGRQVKGNWRNRTKKVARGKLKEMLQKGLSAGALEEKANKLKGLKGTNRINASKESYSAAREEMHKEQRDREEIRKKISLRQNRRYGDFWG